MCFVFGYVIIVETDYVGVEMNKFIAIFFNWLIDFIDFPYLACKFVLSDAYCHLIRRPSNDCKAAEPIKAIDGWGGSSIN